MQPGTKLIIVGDHLPYNQSDEPRLLNGEIVTVESVGPDGKIYVRRENGELQATRAESSRPL